MAQDLERDASMPLFPNPGLKTNTNKTTLLSLTDHGTLPICVNDQFIYLDVATN